jgi:hypothetical protein
VSGDGFLNPNVSSKSSGLSASADGSSCTAGHEKG